MILLIALSWSIVVKMSFVLLLSLSILSFASFELSFSANPSASKLSWVVYRANFKEELPQLITNINFEFIENYSESKKWTQNLIRGTNNPEYLNRYAMILLKEGEIGEAGEVIKKGRKIDSRYPGLIYNDIIYHIKIDQFDKAKNLLNQIPRDHDLFEKSRIYIQNKLNKNI